MQGYAVHRPVSYRDNTEGPPGPSSLQDHRHTPPTPVSLTLLQEQPREYPPADLPYAAPSSVHLQEPDLTHDYSY